jgi:EAL domain-containing protein (putative c-di-GMP-specific phosphodiesterase class I)
LKIDRSFISEVDARAGAAGIVRTIITLAKSLNMQVIAEGVETPEQLQHLRDLDCDLAQGNYFSEAMEAVAATAFLQSPPFFGSWD